MVLFGKKSDSRLLSQSNTALQTNVSKTSTKTDAPIKNKSSGSRRKTTVRSNINIHCEHYKTSCKSFFVYECKQDATPLVTVERNVVKDVTDSNITFTKTLLGQDELETQQQLDRQRRGSSTKGICSNRRMKCLSKSQQEYYTVTAKDAISPILIDPVDLECAIKICKETRHDLASGSPITIPCKVLVEKDSEINERVDQKPRTLIISPTPVTQNDLNKAFKEAKFSNDSKPTTYELAVHDPILEAVEGMQVGEPHGTAPGSMILVSAKGDARGLCVERGSDSIGSPIHVFPVSMTLVDPRTSLPQHQQGQEEVAPNPVKNAVDVDVSTHSRASEKSDPINTLHSLGKAASTSAPLEMNSKVELCKQFKRGRYKSQVLRSTDLKKESRLKLSNMADIDNITNHHQRSKFNVVRNERSEPIFDKFIISEPESSDETDTLSHLLKSETQTQASDVMMNILMGSNSCDSSEKLSSEVQKSRKLLWEISECGPASLNDNTELREFAESDPMLARVLQRIRKHGKFGNEEESTSELAHRLVSKHSYRLELSDSVTSRNDCRTCSEESAFQPKYPESRLVSESNMPFNSRMRQTDDGKIFMKHRNSSHNRFYSYLEEAKRRKESKLCVGLFGVEFNPSAISNLDESVDAGPIRCPDYILNQRLPVPRHQYSLRCELASDRVYQGVNNSRNNAIHSTHPTHVPVTNMVAQVSNSVNSPYYRIHEEGDNYITAAISRGDVDAPPSAVHRKNIERSRLEKENVTFNGVADMATGRETGEARYEINLSPSPVTMKEAIDAQTDEILKCVYQMGRHATKPSILIPPEPSSWLNSIDVIVDHSRRVEDAADDRWTEYSGLIHDLVSEGEQEEPAKPCQPVFKGCGLKASMSDSLTLRWARDETPKAHTKASGLVQRKEKGNRNNQSIPCPDSMCEGVVSSMTMLAHFSQNHEGIPFALFNITNSISIKIKTSEIGVDKCRIAAFFHVVEKIGTGPFVLMVSISSKMHYSLLAWLLEMESSSLCALRVLKTRRSEKAAVSYTGPTVCPRTVQTLADVQATGCYAVVNKVLLKNLEGGLGEIEIVASVLS